jgi:hypothetical protein
MIPDRFPPPRRGERLDFGFLAGIASSIGSHRPRRQFRGPILSRRFSPSLRDQDLGIMRRQLEAITHGRMFEVDTVDHCGVFAYQTDRSSIIQSSSAGDMAYRLSWLVTRTVGFPWVPVHFLG